MAPLNVQFIAGPDGRPAYAILPIDEYYGLLGGNAGSAGAVDPYQAAYAAPAPAPLAALGLEAEYERPPMPPAPERPPMPDAVRERVEAGDNPILVWREERGLTREALAGFIGFQEDDIEAFESGEITPSVEICQMLAMALDVDFEQVIPI